MTDLLVDLDTSLKAARTALDGLIAERAATVAPTPVQAPVTHGLADAGAFFDVVRQNAPLGPALTQAEVDGCTRILKACVGQPLAYAAYILATEIHETAGQMRPIAEYGKGRGRTYGVPGRNNGQIAYGRGDVQLTWDDGYEKADRELGLNGALIANYDLALDPEISARIIVRGMAAGWFTGKSLATYLPAEGSATREQFTMARRIVNGTDKAELIAGYAMTVQAGLTAGGWA